MNFFKVIVDAVKEKVDSFVENQEINQEQSSERPQPQNQPKNGSMTTHELAILAEKTLELIEAIKESFPSDDDSEKTRIIELYNKLSTCYLKLNMPRHALVKMKELDTLPGIEVDKNSNYLFVMSDIHCKLENYKDALECCLKLKKFDHKPSENLDKAIVHLMSKVEKEESIAKPTVEVKFESESSTPDLLSSSSFSCMEPLFEPSTSFAPTARVSPIFRQKDNITKLKEFWDQRKIMGVDYQTLSQNPFKVKCIVEYRKNGQSFTIEMTGDGSNQKFAKHEAAKEMVGKLKELKVITYGY